MFADLIFVKKQSQELSRVNPNRNIFSINVELTSTFFTLQRFGPSQSLNFKLGGHNKENSIKRMYCTLKSLVFIICLCYSLKEKIIYSFHSCICIPTA